MNSITSFFAGIMAFVSSLFGHTQMQPITTAPASIAGQISTAQEEVLAQVSTSTANNTASSTVNSTSSLVLTTTSTSKETFYDQLSKNKYTVDYIYKKDTTANNGSSIKDYMVFIAPTGEKIKVPTSVENTITSPWNRTLKRYEGQELLGSDLPFDPTNKILYIATSEKNPGHKFKETLRIYRYDLITSKLNEFHSETRDDTILSKNYEGASSTTELDIIPIGIEGNKILFYKDIPDSSLGPCTDFWLHASRYGVLYLDTQSPNKGMQNFTVTSDILERSKLDTQKCKEEL